MSAGRAVAICVVWAAVAVTALADQRRWERVWQYARSMLDARTAMSAPKSAPEAPSGQKNGHSVDSGAGVCGDPRRPLPEFW